MKNKLSKIKEGNLWYPPTKSLYDFLDRVKSSGLPMNLAVLGCADGNYVLPAVQKGFDVLAIEIDKIALYGGVSKIGRKNVEVLGLRKKLENIRKQDKVKIINQSYLEYTPKSTFSGVIVSEGLHYEANANYSLKEIVKKIQTYVSVNGLIMVEHLHFSEKNNDPKRYLTSSQLAAFFDKTKWKVTSNKKKTYLEEANLRINRVHKVIIGRLYAKRLK